ncbi:MULTISPECIES: TetR/AcrR family transcriptional regulator [Parafrankia]|uniref:TetR family transcriptional regulator n=1 Tax=Parafrankia soli TaxID=2599596 RepID=A0A1S1RM40_9ACTN|nr:MULTISPECIES: TetR/AcrR family transcriptional regulator [Parafrankia]OHV46881.1 TetR family transcriptional regulator [Parafrankia soli]TCJ40346.1 TetR/AcrR family transcriptional regulator [Parafrankia sp. BMG5.11]CAI7973637.1 Transcriptional regulator, TetR family [Frankia sp. Hr75.2]SQD99619.1 Transcriptional regulator, TetR family [Parafrankia sp. Ea1.12]
MTAEPAAPQSRPGRTPRLPRTARRFQLLGAAREVFVAQGYHAAAMDEIAERAGVSKPVLYQHFPGKLDLYLALLDEHSEKLVSAVRAALASTTDNHIRIERSIRAYFDFVADPSGAHQLVLESDLRSEPAVRQRVENTSAQCVRAIAATIVADTGLPQEEADLLAMGLVGLAESGARWWLLREGRVSKERAVESLVELAWRGIAGYPQQPATEAP